MFLDNLHQSHTFCSLADHTGTKHSNQTRQSHPRSPSTTHSYPEGSSDPRLIYLLTRHNSPGSAANGTSSPPPQSTKCICRRPYLYTPWCLTIRDVMRCGGGGGHDRATDRHRNGRNQLNRLISHTCPGGEICNRASSSSSSTGIGWRRRHWTVAAIRVRKIALGYLRRKEIWFVGFRWWEVELNLEDIFHRAVCWWEAHKESRDLI